MIKNKTKRLVMTALFAAIVVVLQYLGSFIHFGVFSISLVLVPIVIGAALCGPLCGAVLGFVFGLVVLISGDAGAFLVVNPLGTVLTVLVKGAAAGYMAGLVYTLVSKKSENLAVICAALVCPVTNTGLFLVGCLLFFMETITMWAGGTNVGTFMITGLVGMNFIFETMVNIVLSPVIVRLLKASKKIN